MLANSTKISQKVIIFSLMIKLVLFTSLGLFLPIQALAIDTLEIYNLQVEVEENRAIITWRTNLDATSRVDFGLTTDYTNYIYTLEQTKRHKIILSNLSRDTVYHFNVTSSNSNQTVSSFDSVFDIEDFDDQTDPEITNLRVPYITGSTATFQWYTDELASAYIFYGETPEYGLLARSCGNCENFDTTIAGLQPNSEYYYRVEVADKYRNSNSQTGHFHTAPNRASETIPLEISQIKPISDNDPDISYTAAQISWHTNKLANSSVGYGTDPNRMRSGVYADGPFRSVNHTARLTNLQPNTRYYFYIYATDLFRGTDVSSVHSFITKPLPTEGIHQSSIAEPGPVSQFLSLLTRASALYKDASSGRVYSVVNDQKHYIANSNIFNRYGYLWQNVRTASRDFLDRLTDTRLVKDPATNKIYYLADKGDQRWLKIDLPSPSVFSSYAQNRWDKVVTVDKVELDNYSDTKLVKSMNNSVVYLLEGGVKRPIASGEVFESMGFKWSDIVELNDTHLDSYHTGSTIQ